MKTKEIGIKANSNIFFATPSNQSLRLFYYITCIGHFYYEDFYKLNRDSYNSFLIMYIVKGRAKIYNDNVTFEVNEGDTVFMNCHSPHGYESLGGLETIWLHFDGNNTKDIFTELENLYGGAIAIKNSFYIMDFINKVHMAYQAGKKVSEGVQSSYIGRILAEFFNITEDNNSKSILIQKIVCYIDEHYKDDLTVNYLATKASLSEFHFSRIFKKETGFTIHEYIIKTRITNAKNLLQLTSLSLKEISFRCGFINESSFSTSFKKNTGFTPGVFRSMKF